MKKKSIFILSVFTVVLLMSCKSVFSENHVVKTEDGVEKENVIYTTFSIEYKNCEDALNSNPTTFTKGNSIELIPAQYHYNSEPKNFKGWYISNSYKGGEVRVINDDFINKNPQCKETGKIELYALWEKVY